MWSTWMSNSGDKRSHRSSELNEHLQPPPDHSRFVKPPVQSRCGQLCELNLIECGRDLGVP